MCVCVCVVKRMAVQGSQHQHGCFWRLVWASCHDRTSHLHAAPADCGPSDLLSSLSWHLIYPTPPFEENYKDDSRKSVEHMEAA